ncbi:MAG: prolipoprotein diacylglyceryl transferase [Candidatus Ratteibacteria bacterium]|nr:prolipoprotein diacylglyceryl transferase [Candidatus Ratteibacteria bacterium]
MYPILFRIGRFEIYSYGVLVAIAFYISLFLLIKDVRRQKTDVHAKKENIDSSTILDIAFWIIISGILGGKLAYIIVNPSLYIQNPLDASLWRGGFIFYGGLFLSLVAVFIYTKKKKISFLSIADLFVPYAALGEAIGRIGCFLNGCCYGKPTALPIGKVFAINSPAFYHYGALPLHPAQLYSSVFLFILFLVLKKIKTNQKFSGETLLFYLILYPAFRFLLDFLRGDSLGIIFYGLTLFQVICAGIVFISLVILILKKISEKSG